MRLVVEGNEGLIGLLEGWDDETDHGTIDLNEALLKNNARLLVLETLRSIPKGTWILSFQGGQWWIIKEPA